jgi:hypothetical protein
LPRKKPFDLLDRHNDGRTAVHRVDDGDALEMPVLDEGGRDLGGGRELVLDLEAGEPAVVRPAHKGADCRERGGLGGRSSCARWSIDLSGLALAARRHDDAVVV